MESGEPMYTTIGLAKRWHIHPGTLEAWRSAKKGPPYIKMGKGKRSKILYRISDITKWEQRWIKQP